ncbi:MAG: RES family NAD+ phosphorylase [Holophaga sp.]
MIQAEFPDHPWNQLKFLSISPLAQLVPPADGPDLAALLARVGVFRSWPSGSRNADRLPQLWAYLRLPGHGPASRFCDGSFRVVYAGLDLATCRAEIVHHHGLALRDSSEPPGAVRIFEVLALRATGRFLDVRSGHLELHRPEDYARSQAFGRSARSDLAPGIVYRSVRRRGGECLAVVDGRAVRRCALEALMALRWDGERLA